MTCIWIYKPIPAAENDSTESGWSIDWNNLQPSYYFRHSVTTAAENDSRKLGGSIDWNDTELIRKVYSLFLGTLVIKVFFIKHFLIYIYCKKSFVLFYLYSTFYFTLFVRQNIDCNEIYFNHAMSAPISQNTT